MGLILDVTDRVSIELRRESAILYVGSDDNPNPDETGAIEVRYEDVEGIIDAFQQARNHTRCVEHLARKR